MAILAVFLLLIAITILVIPNADAESYDEFKLNAKGINTHHEYFEVFSSWASDNKDILGKDVSFWVENKGSTKADFSVSNISLIPLEKEFHYILSFDTNVKLESQLRYPHEFVMDGRTLTVNGVTEGGREYFNWFGNPLCDSTGIEFNSESEDTGTFHSCFHLIGNDEVGNTGAGEVEGVAIYVKDRLGDRQPINVITVADIENTEEGTISEPESKSWFDNIIEIFMQMLGRIGNFH
jgi:hypothetical protein